MTSQVKRVVIGGAILVAVVFGLIAYFDFARGDGARITIDSAPEGAVIFLDNKRIGRSDGSATMLSNLTAGTHLVLVAKDGYWPWGKELTLAEEEQTVVTPFILQQEVSVDVRTEDDETYEALRALLDSNTLPSEERPLRSDDETTELWLANETITASWVSDMPLPPAFCMRETCEPELAVHESQDTIRALAFYPNRNDVVLFAARNGIFAIELDKRGTQNFQPVYVGTAPTFAVQPNQQLAIEEGEEIFLLEL